MLDFRFLFLLRMLRMLLISFTVTCGHLLYSACLAIDIIWSLLMIFLITLGLSLCALSLRPSPPSSTSLPGCPLSSASPLRPSSVTTGVQLRMSCPYTSPQNGKAERMIRTTNDVVRTLLIQASLPPRFWAESLHTTTYLLNRLPSTASPAPTPHHALFGTPPRYDHLRVFGCALP